jgi:hypothetical protein
MVLGTQAAGIPPRRAERPLTLLVVLPPLASVLGVPDEEDALDGVHGGAGEAGHGVYGGGGALGVALEDEAHVGVGGEGSGDLVDDLRMEMLAH